MVATVLWWRALQVALQAMMRVGAVFVVVVPLQVAIGRIARLAVLDLLQQGRNLRRGAQETRDLDVELAVVVEAR